MKSELSELMISPILLIPGVSFLVRGSPVALLFKPETQDSPSLTPHLHLEVLWFLTEASSLCHFLYLPLVLF